MQQIGADYNESFSLVANDITTWIPITLVLYYSDWICRSIDIEVACLKVEVKEPK